MAQKKVINSALLAKAVAKVKEGKSFMGKWGVGEHLACMRYAAVDALADAESTMKVHNAKPENKDKQIKFADAYNAVLKQAFASDPEFAYASNFQKLLVASGEIKETSEYD